MSVFTIFAIFVYGAFCQYMWTHEKVSLKDFVVTCCLGYGLVPVLILTLAIKHCMCWIEDNWE